MTIAFTSRGPAAASETKPEAKSGVTAAAAGPAGETPDGLDRLVTPRFVGVRRRSFAASVALRFSIPAAVVFLWWFVLHFDIVSQKVLVHPLDIVAAFNEVWENGMLVQYFGTSLQRSLIGVFFGVAAGLVFGVLSGLNALGEELIDPMMQIKRAVPFLALVPLFISWFGIDEAFKIILIAAATVTPMYTYTYLGVRYVDRKIIEAAKGFGLGRLGLVFEVILPLSLPNILMALRVCLAISITALIAAEQVGTTEGIGYLVSLARQYYRPDYIFLCIILYATLGVIFDIFVRLLERYAMPWRQHVAAR